MARGRMINTTVREDKRLNELSAEAALVYLMTIPHLDRDGIITGDAWLLFCDVCPLRRELATQIDGIVEEWRHAGLVVQYETDNGPALWFCGFAKNQQGMHYTREAPSKYAPPPSMVRTDSGLIESSDDCDAKPNPDELRTDSGPTPGEDQHQHQHQHQEEDQHQREAPPLAADDDGAAAQALIMELRANRFAYIDKDPKRLADNLISEFGSSSCLMALEKTAAKHLEQISNGQRGIMAPLAYMRSILSNGNGTGYSPAKNKVQQSMDAFDEFERLVAEKGIVIP